MATGDISNVMILPSGWQATAEIELPSGGTYNWGLGENNDPALGTPTVVFTVVSQGYTNGVLGTRTRTVYGTVHLRKPYPNADLTDELGSDPVTIKFALSDYIYDSDNSSGGTGGNSGIPVTVTILAGLYTHGGTPSNAITDVPVTNNSTETYPRVVGNWSEPGYSKIGTVQRLRMVAYSGYARERSQVECVKFTSTDSSGHSAAQTVTTMTIDPGYGDQCKICEYIADLDTSGFTQGDVVTSDFIAYPWIGNGYSVLDTAGVTPNSTPGTPQPTHLYGPINFIADPAGTYSQYIAVVDPIGGDDVTATVSTDYTLCLPFLNIGAAYNALRAQNNTAYGRNNCGGSTIYLNAGNHTWLGTALTVGSDPQTYLTIRAYPGLTRGDVAITTQAGGKSAGKLCKIQSLRWICDVTANIDPAVNSCVYWMDDVEINQPTAASLWSRLGANGVFHFTRGHTPAYKQGFRKVGGATGAVGILRGSNLNTNVSYPITGVSVILGNSKTNNQLWSGIADYDATIPSASNTVVAHNRLSGPYTLCRLYQSSSDVHGSAVVQNVFEATQIGQPSVQFCADGASQFAVKNLIVLNNTFACARNNINYNDHGGTLGAGARRTWFFCNNLFQGTRAMKTDTFSGNSGTATRTPDGLGAFTVTVTQTSHNYQTGDTIYVNATPSEYTTAPTGRVCTVLSSNQLSYTNPTGSASIAGVTLGPHPLRTGNWPDGYGVGCSGNFHAEENLVAAGSFMQNFPGLRTYCPTSTQGATGPATATANVIGYCKFNDPQSYQGSNGTAGGDYHLQADSPVLTLHPTFIGLPFDFDGRSRTSGGAAGAYELATVSGLLLLRRRRMR